MSSFFKSKKKFGLIFGSIFLVLTIAAGTIAGVMLGGFLDTSGTAGEEDPPHSQEEASPQEEWPEEEGSPEPDPEPEPTEPTYNIPAEMRGVWLVPGYDFLKDLNASEEKIKEEIDKAMTDAVNFTMNSVIIDTVYNDQVIFDTADAPRLSTGFDVMEYLVDSARERGLHVYAIFDASKFEQGSDSAVQLLSLSAGSISSFSANLREFADRYAPDAILLDGYTASRDDDALTYPTYLVTGGAVGYDNYIRQTPATVVKTAGQTIRRFHANIQVGLLADAVWANESDHSDGTPTNASFTALVSGNADTKAFVEAGYVDFVAVKAYSTLSDKDEPFETVVDWWADVARQSDVPMYVVHASSKLGTSGGWTSQDQLAKQVIKAAGVSGYGGSMFDSLSKLVANQSATSTLVKLYEGEVKTEHILTELAITKPEKMTYTTQEPTVTFTGASDPNSPVTINDREITTDSSGYFTVNYDLQAGENPFTVAHKDKTLTYKITRNIEILKEITPSGVVTTDGGMTVKISALAYENATVTASVNGSVVNMAIDDSPEDEAARDSSYKRFVGYYPAPAGTAQEQNLGAITVSASWQGLSKSLSGAVIKVNKKAKMEDGVSVVVVSDQAWTYPPNTLDNMPSTKYYPIPKGAMDYAVGDEITYVSDKGITYKYYNLASGLRVESGDIQATNDYVAGNVVSGFNISTEGRYTYVTIQTAQKVTYKIDYTGGEFTITFNHTSKNPGGSQTLNKNPLFTHAAWGSDSLTLTLAKAGGFMGYKGYYDASGNLVFRFNTPPASLSGARIAIDAGHGGSDYGALGFLAAYPEKVINKGIAEYLAGELESRGATVLLIDNAGNPSLLSRVRQAEAFNADLFVSVHNNTGTRLSAVGTETYYFYPYAKSTAAAIASQVSSRLGSENRGAKQSYYHITLSAQVPSVLAECGFLTNKAEYEKLIQPEYQHAIAIGLADGLAAGIQSAYTGVTTTGTQSVGSQVPATSDSGNVSVGDATLEYLTFEYDEVKVNEGATYALKLLSDPEDANLAGVTYKSGNTSVATVSMTGKVSAHKVGTAKIIASSADGKITATCVVEVVENGGEADSTDQTKDGISQSGTVPLSTVDDPYFSEEDLTLTKSSTYTVEVLSSKGRVRNTDFLWSSDDTKIATVDSGGKITAKTAGDTTITAYTADYAHYITFDLYVVAGKVAVKSISLSKEALYLKKGTTQQLYVTFNPTGATNKGITWSTSKKSVATVDENGLITAKSSGTAVITATSKDGKFTAKCTVEVTAKAVGVEEMYLDEEDGLELAVGDYTQLVCWVYPENATDASINWKSSNPSVVAVDQNGNIECLKAGTATVTATSVSTPKISASCVIEVYSP